MSTGLIRELLADSPAGLWPLDNPSGTTASDVSGNARHATIQNSPTFVAGPGPGGAYSFASNQRIAVADNAIWSSTGSEGLTVGCFFKYAGGGGSVNYLVAKNSGSGSSNQEWDMRLTAAGSVGLATRRADQTGYRVAQTVDTFADDLWHWAVATYDGTSAYPVVHVDGSTRSTNNSGTFNSRAGDTSAVLSIGNNGAGTGGNEPASGSVAFAFFVSDVAVSASRLDAYWREASRLSVVV